MRIWVFVLISFSFRKSTKEIAKDLEVYFVQMNITNSSHYQKVKVKCDFTAFQTVNFPFWNSKYTTHKINNYVNNWDFFIDLQIIKIKILF